jgi:hypothetical protein
MITIDNELELFSIKGNVVAGKLLLLSILENKHLNHDDIKTKVVDEYGIMKLKHFIRTWKEYQKMKRFMTFGEE